MPRGGSPEASDEGSAQADMEQQHMTQVAVLDTGTYCRAWFIAAVVSFYSSPRSRCCACLGRCGRGQVVTRAPHRIWRVAGQPAGATKLTLKTYVCTVESRCMTCQPSARR